VRVVAAATGVADVLVALFVVLLGDELFKRLGQTDEGRRRPGLPCRATTSKSGFPRTSPKSLALVRFPLTAAPRADDGHGRARDAPCVAATRATKCRPSCARSSADSPARVTWTPQGAWNKLVAVVRDDDHEAMLTHALIQSRRRDRT
jgi:hypothetical protein